MKKYLLLSIALTNLTFVTSCTNDNFKQTVIFPQKISEKTNIYNFQVTDKKTGKDITVNIPNQAKFLTKATTDGSAAKTFANVRSYKFYLIKNASPTTYPLNGDPMADAEQSVLLHH